jgi:hypothetical protein
MGRMRLSIARSVGIRELWAKPKEVDPWALADEPNLDVPQCAHGDMRRKTGLKKDGTPYAGWVCKIGADGQRCEAIWDRS